MVLDRRVQNKSKLLYHKLLIKWMDLPPQMVTWEDEDEFIAHFPSLTAWGQVKAQVWFW
jgi:hypothetical protein